MKIAVVSDDHQTISAHFGRAEFYEVFTLDGQDVVSRETVAKTNHQVVALGGRHETGGGHHHQHDHNAMITPVADCEVLLSRGMGRGAYTSLQQHGIRPIITDIRDIQAAIRAYIDGSLVDHPEKLH